MHQPVMNSHSLFQTEITAASESPLPVKAAADHEQPFKAYCIWLSFIQLIPGMPACDTLPYTPSLFRLLTVASCEAALRSHVLVDEHYLAWLHRDQAGHHASGCARFATAL